MLATLAGESGLADASVVIDGINTLAIVSAGIQSAVIDVDVAHVSHPSRVADALISEKFVHTVAVDAVGFLAEIHLLFATLSSKAAGAIAGKIVNQVGTRCTQKARAFCAVIDVNLTMDAFPSRRTAAVVASLIGK